MSNQLLPINHFTLNITADIKSICKPLEQHGINFFTHIRCYNNAETYVLTSNRDAYYNHFQKEYLLAPYIAENMLAEKFYYWAVPAGTDLKFNKSFIDYKDLFDVGNPFYLFERKQDFVDFYIYASNANNYKIINFYLNNVDYLESFNAYFRDKASKIIQRADTKRIVLPEHMCLNFKGLVPNDDISKNLRLLKEQTKTINQLLRLCLNTQLTPRELQSLSYLLKGRTAAETALALNISPKTVESYIESVKNKLNCLSRADLFDKVLELSLFNLIIRI